MMISNPDPQTMKVLHADRIEQLSGWRTAGKRFVRTHRLRTSAEIGRGTTRH